MWKSLPDEEKNIWKEAARLDKVRYFAETKDYKGPVSQLACVGWSFETVAFSKVLFFP